jgi:hypothetical protein
LQLFAELTGTSDYREAREDLGNRLWDMIRAASEQSTLREELFNWAGSGRTCADSVIGCFSALEVRVQVAQMLRRADAGQAEGAAPGNGAAAVPPGTGPGLRPR